MITRVPNITIGITPPVTPLEGDLWWNPTNGIQSVWYDDGTTAQWVQSMPVKYINLATLMGDAGGDLTGQYPNPQILPNVVMEQPQIDALPNATLNDLHLVPAQWVKDRIAGLVGVPIPPTSVPYGAADGNLKGDALEISYDEVTNILKVAKINGDIEKSNTLVISVPAGQAIQQLIGGSVVTMTNGGSYFPNPDNAMTLGDNTHRWSSVWAVTLPLATSDDRTATTKFVKDNIAALPTTFPPSGAAGGALAGTYPNPTLAVAYPTTLPPNGPAGGALAGTYPNPTLVGGPLSNYALTTSIPTTLPPNGPAGGDLQGTYPNPAIKPSVTNGFVLTTVAGVATWAAGGSAVHVGTAPPASPAPGQLWWYSDGTPGGGQMLIYYNDGNSIQWVPASPANTVDFGFRLLGRVTLASAAANINVANWPADINDVQLTFDLNCSVNAQDLVLQYFDNTGAIVNAGGSYAAATTTATHAQAAGNPPVVMGSVVSTVTSGIALTYSAVNRRVSSTSGIRGSGSIINVRNPATQKAFNGQTSYTSDDSAVVMFNTVGGQRAANGLITGVRLVWGSGNVTAGSTLAVWGSP